MKSTRAAVRGGIRESSPRHPHLPATWLAGRKVRLRPVEPEDLRLLQHWLNEATAREWLAAPLPRSKAKIATWAARVSTDPSHPGFIIQTRSGADIGLAVLQVKGARAELAVAIHEARFWGCGYGEEIVRLLVDGAFAALPLRRIELRVLTGNDSAIRAYERAGFSREGVLRKAIHHMGRARDQLVMSVLHEEWMATRAPST